MFVIFIMISLFGILTGISASARGISSLVVNQNKGFGLLTLVRGIVTLALVGVLLYFLQIGIVDQTVLLFGFMFIGVASYVSDGLITKSFGEESTR